jgi:hypothetical protein
MKPSACSAAAVLALTLSLGVAKASGPIAVYALVDKVALEPNENMPQRIRLTGVFITAEGDAGNTYSAPRRGYLYFTLPGVNSELALREWRDLKSVAGTRQVIGLGSIWYGKVRVWKPNEKAKFPDAYVMGNGLVKINADQPRAKALLEYKDH